MPEVGASLALRKRNSLLSGAGDTGGKQAKRRQRSSDTRDVEQKVKEERQTNASFQIFIEAGSLYVLCIILPNIVSGIGSALKSVLEDNAVFRKATIEVCSGPFLNRFQYCQGLLLRTHGNDVSFTPLTAAIAPDAGISDVAIVVFLSISLAIVRLGLVHILVPDYDQPKRMRAFVRCKSIHLLSSQYTGNGTPRPLKNDTIEDSVLASLPPMPSLESNHISNGERTNSATVYNDTNTSPLYLGGERIRPTIIQTSAPDNESFGEREEELWRQMELARNELEDEDYYDDSPPPPAVSSGLISSSSAHSLQALLQQANPGGPRARRESFKQDDLLSFTSPKFATAAFRLFYCTISCTIALFYFLDADFWPAAVGGNGNTKNCWDLSSVGPTVMESDFDQHNKVLRRFFLLQASYHFHSGAFHLFTAILLWFVSSSPKNQEEEEANKFFGFIPYGMITVNNVKTLLQHCFAVGLITFIFLFSSLRRLGAIGIFSFDASSLALHLLQLCINDSSQRVTAFWIRLLHRAVVIPLFCFTRFYIFPFVIGYSALEESQDWLRQLENMLVPGIAKHIHGAFVVSFVVVMTINVVYFHRLLNHPHVQEALQRSKEKYEEEKKHQFPKTTDAAGSRYHTVNDY